MTAHGTAFSIKGSGMVVPTTDTTSAVEPAPEPSGAARSQVDGKPSFAGDLALGLQQTATVTATDRFAFDLELKIDATFVKQNSFKLGDPYAQPFQVKRTPPGSDGIQLAVATGTGMSFSWEGDHLKVTANPREDPQRARFQLGNKTPSLKVDGGMGIPVRVEDEMKPKGLMTPVTGALDVPAGFAVRAEGSWAPDDLRFLRLREIAGLKLKGARGWRADNPITQGEETSGWSWLAAANFRFWRLQTGFSYGVTFQDDPVEPDRGQFYGDRGHTRETSTAGLLAVERRTGQAYKFYLGRTERDVSYRFGGGRVLFDRDTTYGVMEVPFSDRVTMALLHGRQHFDSAFEETDGTTEDSDARLYSAQVKFKMYKGDHASVDLAGLFAVQEGEGVDGPFNHQTGLVTLTAKGNFDGPWSRR